MIELRGRVRDWGGGDDDNSDWPLLAVLLVGIPLVTLALIVSVIVWLA